MRSTSWVVEKSHGMFVASVVGTPDALVVAAGGCVPEAGAVVAVVVFVPGSLLGAIAVMPRELPS
jgi:hypothetical protein